MFIITVPFSALQPGGSNPRQASDDALIAGLAASIRADGLLHNLVVRPAKRSKYRVIAGTRRYRALALLKAEGAIDGDYAVPVEVRETSDDEAFRLATVENVQREPLDPIDEAEAFAALFQTGAALADVAARTGTGERTIRRRLALANLCDEAKQAVRAGELSLGVAEALTLGSPDAQREILAQQAAGYALEADDVRFMLTEARPSAALALFPLDAYRGTWTTDLFGEAETTYFDDVAEFFRLQEAAVEERAAACREHAAWVEVVRAASVPWWQYRAAEDGEAGGVLIHMSPSGRVEMREGLVPHAVEPHTAAATRAPAPRAAPSCPAALVRYVVLRQGAIVQAALLESPRKAKEVAALALLRGLIHAGRVKVDAHPWLPALAEEPVRQAGEAAVQAELARLAGWLGAGTGESGHADPCGWTALVRAVGDASALYEALGGLADDALDRLLIVVPLLAFGQHDLTRLDDGDGLFGRVARDLAVDVRRFWRPDGEFLEQLKRAELCEIAIESGAAVTMGRLADYRKGDLVRFLDRYFERTAGQMPHADELAEKGRAWVPALMAFAAPEQPATEDEDRA